MHKNDAVSLLKEKGYTLVLYTEEECRTFTERGVSPLLSLVDSGEDFSGYLAVDKVVGRAAAFLYIALGVRGVYAVTVSESAYRLLRERGIIVEYEARVARILNRTETGFCPMESAVLEESDPAAAIEKIRKTLLSLRAGAQK